jgi:hypothetical protein
MKVSARITSKALSLEADSGVVWEEKHVVSDVDRTERKRSHREQGEKTRIGNVVRDIHHECGRVGRLKYTENYKGQEG